MSGKEKKSANYIAIQLWMFSNLKLSVNEALVLAIIYGFSQDGTSWYRGGSSYIERVTPLTQRTAKTHLATLVRLGIIEMQKEKVNGIDCNIYRTIPHVDELVLPDRAKSAEKAPSHKKYPDRENFSPVKTTSSDLGKIFTQTGEKIARKNYIENYKREIYQSAREARVDGLMDHTPREESVRERFHEKLEIDTLALRYDPDELRELLDNIVDMYCCTSPCQYIGQQMQSTKAVQIRLDRLTSRSVEYILTCLSSSTRPVTNIRAYLRATILNAPTTEESYYRRQAGTAMAVTRSCQPSSFSGSDLTNSLKRLKKGGHPCQSTMS